jgi:hypothetical protein
MSAYDPSRGPQPLELEPILPRVESEAFLYTALGVFGSIMASAVPLALGPRNNFTTFSSELFRFFGSFTRPEFYFVIPPVAFLVLSFPLLRSGRRPTIPVGAAATLVVLLALATLHEVRLRQIGYSAGTMTNWLVYRYSSWVLALAIAAWIQNRKSPSLESAYLFCVWQTVWLFALGFPSFANVW